MIGRPRANLSPDITTRAKNIGAENFSTELALAKVFLSRSRAENAHRAMRRCE
jgi:hypothetical protein